MYNFVKFVATLEGTGMTSNFFYPSMFLDPGSGMGKNQDPGSGINIPDPPHCAKAKKAASVRDSLSAYL
jgi:hypothetical protein